MAIKIKINKNSLNNHFVINCILKRINYNTMYKEKVI